MQLSALRALEFDRIVEAAAGLAATPMGRAEMAALRPMTEPARVIAALRATSEAVRFLADRHGLPLRAPADVGDALAAIAVEGRALEPLRLLGLGDFLESIEQTQTAIREAAADLPRLSDLVNGVATFTAEIADVRRAIEASGEVADGASPLLASIRDRLRTQKARLRSTLDAIVRGRDTARYLQEQVVTDRNGRYVLIVRAEHRSAIPGVVHGGSASGASLYVEPLETVDINNDIVALGEQEAEEIQRILLALTDRFRRRAADLDRTIQIATALDAIQARGRLSRLMGGIEPAVSTDGTFELRGARHPLLIPGVRARLDEAGGDGPGRRPQAPSAPVPVDILLTPPVRALVISGPNTGGKTVAIKTAGLLAAMAQAGLHIPAEAGSRMPVFRSLFADIGDDQSIAASLSTFSAHIMNVVAMDRELVLPALVLLDEVGAGTDPVEGGALGTALIDRFRTRGAHVIATTHHDSLKSYASTTTGVASAAFGFDPATFAPTYRLVYGAPGRSLALEIAARLGVPAPVIEAARANLGEGERRLAEHLAQVDRDLRTIEREREQLAEARAALAAAERSLTRRDAEVRDREDALRRRAAAKVDEIVRVARREVETVIENLKSRAAALSDQAAIRLRTAGTTRAVGISTGDTGAARADALAALESIAARAKDTSAAGPAAPAAAGPIAVGTRVRVGGMGVEGVVVDLHGEQAEIDVRGKRLRAPAAALRAIEGAAPSPTAQVTIDLRPREGSLTEINLIGHSVDDALARLEKFLDDSTVADLRQLRIVHGHGTGQLRRAVAAFLKDHPLVARFEPAPQEQGGGGATLVELKD